jgi:hypothetical protein
LCVEFGQALRRAHVDPSAGVTLGARAASRSSGASGARPPGGTAAKSSGRYTPMPAKVRRSPASSVRSRPWSSAKSPRGWCSGLATSTHQASQPSASSRSAIERARPGSQSHQTSPFTTRNGPSPSSGSAFAMPPAVSSASVSAE